MIDGIRRRFTKSVAKDPWDANLELQPEEAAQALPINAAVLLAARQVPPGFSPGDGDSTGYYRNVVKTAIEHGGKYGDHQIPVPWLKMILAGLESRPIDPEMIWYQVGPENPVYPLPEIPPYEALFASERGVRLMTFQAKNPG